MTDEFTPRLGRLRDRGRGGDLRFAQQLKKAAARLGRPPGKTRFSGAGLGRGGASARALEMRGRRLANFRMRRVIVKTHISRAPKGGGTGALKAHLGYVQRDGLERDGSGGVLDKRGDRTECGRVTDQEVWKVFEEQTLSAKLMETRAEMHARIYGAFRSLPAIRKAFSSIKLAACST